MQIFALAVEAEGVAKHVGPFRSKSDAEKWAAAEVRNGSWVSYPLTLPSQAITV